MSGLASRTLAAMRRIVPGRAQLEGVPLVRRLARRPELWRFTRRSVPRGVAIGLFVGFFALVPGVQVVGAAMLCVPVRGNVPLAAAMTFLSNPVTTPLILAASIWVGTLFGFHADLATLQAMYRGDAEVAQWLRWLVADAAPALGSGLLAISAGLALAGYAVAALGWRHWIGAKRRGRLARARERRT